MANGSCGPAQPHGERFDAIFRRICRVGDYRLKISDGIPWLHEVVGVNRMRFGLRLKLGLFAVGFVMVVLLLTGLLQVQAEREVHLEALRVWSTTLLQSFAIPCTLAIADADVPTLDRHVAQLAETAKGAELLYVAVLDHQGQIMTYVSSGALGREYADAFSETAVQSPGPMHRYGTVGGRPSLEIAVPVVSGLRWGTLLAGLGLGHIKAAVAERRERVLLTSIGVSSGTALIVYLTLSFFVIGPVSRMRELVRRFGEGRLEARLALKQRDEIGDLAGQLDHMASRIIENASSFEALAGQRGAELAETNAKLAAANGQLKRLARTDALTGLYNRQLFMEQLKLEVLRGERRPNHLAVILIDVDHFKAYNDTHGHDAGDALLQRLTGVLELNLRATDVIGRYGGEEFIVILLDTHPSEGFATAKKLQQAVETQHLPLEATQPNGKLTVSIGVSFFPQDSRDSSELIEYAECALRHSKELGRNCVTRFSDL